MGEHFYGRRLIVSLHREMLYCYNDRAVHAQPPVTICTGITTYYQAILISYTLAGTRAKVVLPIQM